MRRKASERNIITTTQGGIVMWLQSGQQNRFDTSAPTYQDKKIVQKSSIMQNILHQLEKVATNSSPAIFIGGQGTGRAMLAQKLFMISHKNNAGLVRINVSKISANKMEAALLKNLDGLNNKTLLIESINDLPKNLQVHVLKHLQSGQHQNCRVIATSNETIYRRMEKKEFREDLFSYFTQNLIMTPLLVERTEDIPELANFFLKQQDFQGQLTPEAIEVLSGHSWRGNITELRNVCMQIATLFKYKVVDTKDLPILAHDDIKIKLFVKYNSKITIEELTNYYIAESVKYFKSKRESAKALGISVKTIYNKIDSGAINISK